MKRSLPLFTLLFVILFSALSFQSVYSQPLLVENFDYDAGTLLTAVGWNAHSGAGTESVNVVVPGLSFTGYPLSGIGGAALIDNNGEDVNKTFPVQTTGTVYAAFMVKVDGSTGGYFMHLGGDPIGTTFRGKLFLIGTASPFNFGLSVGSNTATPLDGGEFTYGTTYLLVLKYEIVDGATNDIVSLFVISGDIPATEPGTPSIGPLTDATQGDINPGTIALRQFNASQNITVDGIRIGKTWAEAVTDIPSADVTAPVFTEGYPKMADIDATQADLEVNMDEAGTAYYVVVPDGSTAPTVAEVVAGADYGTVTLVGHGTVDVASGGATFSSTITGLTDKTDYDIYVVAEDDESTPNRQTDAVMVNLYTIKPPDVILPADFSSSLAPFTQVSITGDQVWAQTSGYAKISGYASSTNNENLDYLISPAINLSASETNMLSFRTMMNYTGPALKVVISTDFSGTYDATSVSAATWTDISSNFSFSTGSWASVNSGEFSLEAYTGTVYIAFVYESTTSEASTWEVDDVLITGYLLPGSDATLSDLKVDDVTIAGFDAAVLGYSYIMEADWSTTPVVTFTTTDVSATAELAGPADLNGDAAARTASVTVVAADGVTSQTYTILFSPIIAVADMAALRAVAPADFNRIYQVTGEVIVTGLNDANRHQKYVQDATAGVTIDDPDGKVTTIYSVGDGIKNLTGTLTDYQNLLELVPYRDPGAAFSTGNTVTPQEVTIADFKTNQESYESELVKIIGVSFSDANGTAGFVEKKNYTISVGTDATILRTIFLGTDLKDKVIPYMADVTGIAAVYSSDAQIAPRNYADLVIYSSDGSLSDLRVSGTTVTGFASGTLTYNVSLAAGTTVVPTVTATPAEANASVVITPAASLTGDAAARTTTVAVTSHDKSTSKTYSIVFSVATGIEENLSGRFTIYPVPARTDITVTDIDDVKFIEIYDVTGKRLITEICESDYEKTIPVSHLARGVYFIRFTTQQGTVMKRFVKE
jgi:hypothetical protein